MQTHPFYSPGSLNCRGKLIPLEAPLVMGVINITSDSFYSGSRKSAAHSISESANKMINEGATFIDLGAASSRPGAKPISSDLEIERLRMACEVVRSECPGALISIDAHKVEILQAIEPYHIDMVNDISGGKAGDEIWSWTGAQRVPYVLMHMKGTPESMQSEARYTDLMAEILDYFIERIPKILAQGIKDVFIDPGIGFAKTVEQNYALLKHLEVLAILDLPIMVGLSRKSLIWKTLGVQPEDGLNGSTALHMHCLNKGAKMLRVHDVKEAMQTIKLWQKLNQATRQTTD
jgi:dihydropteroate synthase